MNALRTAIERIKKAPMNQLYTQAGIELLVHAPKTAKNLLICQTPGLTAQESKFFFDLSIDTLRGWIGVDREIFYHSDLFSLLPMDFYYPCKGKNGDLPPR